ncbi:MAG TPA: ABC transporter permease [Candidatus Acidoferrum sp.]|nr:ABC transporter permease [Candidatus Methylomirabilis sp.]HWU37998.1 ABC transporter permease [Candidatus Acidoferrum sp.]
MHGLFVMYRKELEDHFSSTRFILLLTVILMVSLVTTYMVGTGLRKELEGFAKPSLVFLLLFTSTGALFSLAQFIAFFGPLIGMILGFDAISRERASRTLSKLLSQPIYRDAVINGKFLAGLTIISLMLLSIVLLISGMGLWVLGVVPGWEEVGRLAVYLVISIVYIGFWLAVSILCSILFRGLATSALASLALWIFLAFFMALGASLAADVFSPIPPGRSSDPETILNHEQTRETVASFSPITLYSQAATTILDPTRNTTRSLILMGPMERLSLSRFQNPLPLLQSTLIVMPYLISLVAVTVVCFAICYACFMRQEVRST